MKTSTVFACQIPANDYDLHLLMSLIIEQEESFKQNYGMQKVYSKTLNDYVGIGGLIRNENNIVEGGVLLKSKYISSGIGFWVEKKLLNYMNSKQNITAIAGIWEENTPSIRLAEKHGMQFIKKIYKTYNNKTIAVNLYVEFINSHLCIVPDDKYFTIVKLSKFY
jgi:RimJ/RimL family protein N-acetyltransferase